MAVVDYAWIQQGVLAITSSAPKAKAGTRDERNSETGVEVEEFMGFCTRN